MSLRDEARRATEYALRQREKVVKDQVQALNCLRDTSEWRQRETERANGTIEQIPNLIERRALDGHFDCWIMDIEPNQFVNSEQPPSEYPIQAVQVKLFGAARIVAEWLINEGLRVFIRHKAQINGVHHHTMEARWS